MTQTTSPRIGNKAPDWGHHYNLRELWTEVAPQLWVGGTHDNDTVDVPRASIRSRKTNHFNIVDRAEITPREFDAVVTLYAWARPVDWHVEELRTGVMDSDRPTAEELEQVNDAADWAYRRLERGGKVLIRCQAGLNRAPLVATLVLRQTGLYSSREAIDLIRRKRSDRCLFNEGFERYLLGLDAA